MTFPRLLLAVLLALTFAMPVQAGGKKIAILPFEVLAANDLAYLKEGVRVMLASRLAGGAGVAVVDRAAVDQALAGTAVPPAAQFEALGKQLGADYLLFGNLTAMGGVSLDAKVFSVADGSVQNFFATAAREDEVIGAVDQLAWKVAEKVFGVQPPAGRGQSVAPAGVPAAAVPAYQTAHPERGFMYQQGGTMAAPIVRPGGIGGTSGFVKSPNFRMDLRAMDVGDVDGDGNDEYVLADTQKVSIYRRAENRYTLAGQYEIPHRYRIHGVTIGDLNNNGRGEIYVSAADTKEPRSTVLEWNGKEFAPLFTEQPWYLRALSLPGQGMILAGQKSAVDGPLMPGIHRLEPKGSSLLVQAEKLPVPDMVNLFDFAVADLDGDGASEVIAIDQYDHLLVRRQSGKILYQSDDYYGGTTRFIGGQEAMGMADKATIEDLGRVYVPSRLVIADVNRDGLPDVLINKNLSSSSRVFRNAKSYPSGEIHALTWNGIALTELWRTRKIDGYISDYQLNPDKDGSGGTLAVGIVLRGGVVDSLADGESTVLSYRLDFVADAEKNGDSPAKQ